MKKNKRLKKGQRIRIRNKMNQFFFKKKKTLGWKFCDFSTISQTFKVEIGRWPI